MRATVRQIVSPHIIPAKVPRRVDRADRDRRIVPTRPIQQAAPLFAPIADNSGTASRSGDRRQCHRGTGCLIAQPPTPTSDPPDTFAHASAQRRAHAHRREAGHPARSRFHRDRREIGNAARCHRLPCPRHSNFRAPRPPSVARPVHCRYRRIAVR